MKIVFFFTLNYLVNTFFFRYGYALFKIRMSSFWTGYLILCTEDNRSIIMSLEDTRVMES